MRAWRVALVTAGVLLIVLGAVILVGTVKPVRIAGLGSWLLLALIVHDGIVAFVTFGVALVVRRTGRRLPVAVLALVQGGLVVCSILAIVVLPEVVKKSIGTRNPTVLPLDYGPSLVAVWAGIVVCTAAAIVGYYAVANRQNERPPASQS